VRSRRRIGALFGGVVVELLGGAGDLQRRSLGIEIAGAAAAEIGVEPGMADNRNLREIVDERGRAVDIMRVRVDYGGNRLV